MKKRSTKLKWVGLALASLGMAMSGTALATKMEVDSRGGLYVFCPDNDSYWFTIGGRFNVDETIFNRSGRHPTSTFLPLSTPTGSIIETAFLKFAGGLGECLTYNMTLSFLPPAQYPPFRTTAIDGTIDPFGVATPRSSVDFEDLWVNWAHCMCDINTNFRIGQFTPPTSIDDWGRYGTVNDTPFLRVALDTFAFSVPGKVIGLWGDANAWDMFAFSFAVYEQRQNNTLVSPHLASTNNYFDANRSDRIGLSGRLYFSPIHDECMVVHLGVTGRYQRMSDTTKQGVPVLQQNLFSTTPEALARNTASLVNTGAIRAKSYNVWTPEILGIWGPVWIESEYHGANVQRTALAGTTGSHGNFWGWHVQGGYVFTGESRGYDFATGTMQDPSPTCEFGAWEIVARFSQIDLNKKDIRGGKENNFTVGLNWFVNDHVHFAAQYIAANVRHSPLVVTTTNGHRKHNLNIFGLRAGVRF